MAIENATRTDAEQKPLALLKSKTVAPPIVQAQVGTHIAPRRATLELSQRDQTLEDPVAIRTRELAASQDVTVQALALLVEARGNETSGHVCVRSIMCGCSPRKCGATGALRRILCRAPWN